MTQQRLWAILTFVLLAALFELATALKLAFWIPIVVALVLLILWIVHLRQHQ